jgi:hypothetical protein
MGNVKTSVSIVAGLKTVTYVDPDTETVIGQDIGPATPEEIILEQARVESAAAEVQPDPVPEPDPTIV